MTGTDKPKSNDHNFGSFAMGVAVGVGAALLFGTEEGKKLAGNLFDILPEKIKNLTDQNDLSQYSHSGLDPESSSNNLLQEPESTPHTYIYNEPPPPPAPHVTPTPPRII